MKRNLEKRHKELNAEFKTCLQLLKEAKKNKKKIKERVFYILGAMTLLEEELKINDDYKIVLTSIGLKK